MARAEVTATLTTDQLAALVEVLRSGSFEDAASRLRITPSAVSQRIKSIEEQIGSMVVIRSKPCRPTAVGQRLMQHFEEIMILENRLGADLGKAPDPAILRIGLDEDANSALIIAAMSEVGGVMLDLVTGRESDCAKWLDAGTVTGALTHHASDVAGYDRINLGLAAYVAVASPDFLRSHPLPDTFRSALCLKLGTDDFLPDLWSKAVGWEPAQRAHFFPSTSAIVEGARLGLGWAVVRQSSVADDLAAGRLRSLAGHTLRQPLFWHCRISVRSALARFEIELRRKAETLLTDGSSGQVTGENYNFALK